MKLLLLLFLPLLVIAELDPTHESRLEKRITRFVDNGNLMCITENYPLIQGDPKYFMTLEEANKVVEAVCTAWQIGSLNPGANPGFTNTVYLLDDAQDQGNTNVTVSVTYNGGKNCPSPALNFWFDRNAPGDGSTHCLDRLFTIINGCDTQKQNEYWKQGGSFFRDCATWDIWKSLQFS